MIVIACRPMITMWQRRLSQAPSAGKPPIF